MVCNESSHTSEIAENAHIRKTELAQINNLMLNLKLLERKQVKSKAHIRKKIINIRAEINAMQIKKTIGPEI